MVAVQFDPAAAPIAPVGRTSPASTAADRRAADRRAADLRGRRLRRRSDRWSHDQATDATTEAEDHWADGARAQLAMVGVAFGL